MTEELKMVLLSFPQSFVVLGLTLVFTGATIRKIFGEKSKKLPKI